ncbi:MAG: MarR family winged helix-turn-helix transcriptional regulator [Actinomycetes bacterium]
MPTMTKTAELASTMRVSVMRLARRLRHERPDFGLSLTQIATLATIDRHGPITPREVADHERVQPPSMTRVLCVLEERGLINRTAHPSDGRQQLVSLTREGKELLREDRRRREAWLAVRLAELTAEERDLLRRAAPIIERIANA